MKMVLRSVGAVALVLMLGSCKPDYVSQASHTPASKVVAGEATVMRLQLSVGDDVPGALTKRFTQVKCHYRVQGDKSFTHLDMSLEKEDPNGLTLICTVPPLGPVGGVLEYTFDWRLDGHHLTYDDQTVPIVAAENRDASVKSPR
jgi:hypothetical protein